MIRRATKLALMAGVAASAMCGPALANDWEGLSLGIGGGYGMADGRLHDSAGAFGISVGQTTNGIPNSSGLFSLSAGYDHALLGALVVGGFVDYDFTDIGSGSSYGIGNQLSVGGRLGYLVAPTTLFFSTFGYAHADASNINSGFGFGRADIGSFDGYFVGSGVELLIGGGFSLKAEYRYTSFQSEAAKFDTGLIETSATVKPEIQTARVSLNYRFGDGKHEPVDNSIPPVTSSWTSPYMGLGAGAGTADTKVSTPDVLDAGSGHLGSDGVFLTANVGYDYQLNAHFVAGAFADAEFGNLGYDSSLRLAAGPLSESESVRNKFENMFMVGARLGYLATPDTMLFVSGGYANAGLSDTRFDLRFNGTTVESAMIDGKRFSGGFLGGGIETRINDALSIKAEYRYVDFGSELLQGSSSSFPDADFLATKFDPSLQIGMLSLNWRLARPAPADAASLK
jgi:outer membrane immunogenic protein